MIKLVAPRPAAELHALLSLEGEAGTPETSWSFNSRANIDNR